MILAFLWACTSDDPSSKTTFDSSPTDSTQTDTHSTDTGETKPLPSSAKVLKALEADVDAAIMNYAASSGWPVETQDGWLFVTTDPKMTVVGGDFDGWSGKKLKKEKDFSWALAEVSSGDGYKFGDGRNWTADPNARSYNYDSYGELSLIRPKEAHLDRYLKVSGGGLDPRTVRVWVPSGTVDHVLYAHDGQNLFDPEAIWGGWHLQDSLPPGMLVVGIDNTAARMDEYTHTPDDIGEVVGGKADEYGDLVQNTIRPMIRDQYGENGPVGVMGSSLGGLVSLYFAHRYPEDYAFAASLSGTVGWGSIGLQNPTIIELMAADGHGPVPIYLDSGGGGACEDSDGDGIFDDSPDASDNYCENLQLRDTLVVAGYQYEEDLWHWWEEGAEHNEMSWAARVFRPLDIFAAL